MTKPKYDLSNLGGQPKDWAQRQQDREIEGGLGFKATMLIVWTGLSLAAGAYGLARLIF